MSEQLAFTYYVVPADEPAIVTRAEAQARGLLRYFPGSRCPRGSVAERRTYNGTCLCRLCVLDQRGKQAPANRRWLVENADKVREIKTRSAA